MLIITADGSGSCDHCGKVYNPFLGDRFWSAREYQCGKPEQCNSGGGPHNTLCDDCHRELVREA